ncbi:chromosome partition protein Smc [Oscillibacter sp. CAG:155]|nr:chromosome partition protein Smc [Oscillibacter sp. CAG:155]
MGNIIAGHSLRLEERKKKAAAASEQRMKLTMDTGALDNRIRLLTEMEREYEGFSKAVKLVCQAKGGLRGIHGPVAELVRTEQKYSLAIEIALGGGLQNIVVDREEDAKAAIGFLKQRSGGRATFLPLTAIRGEEMRERGVEQAEGFVGLASRLVRFDPKYQNIFYNLLGRTVVVEDLDCGIALARRYRNAFRIVTLDGQVINRGGSPPAAVPACSAGRRNWNGSGAGRRPCAGSWKRPRRRRSPPTGNLLRPSMNWKRRRFSAVRRRIRWCGWKARRTI